MFFGERVNLAGVDSLDDFIDCVEMNDLFPDLYIKIKSDGTILEFFVKTNGSYEMRQYPPCHPLYAMAFRRAKVSENTFIEGV